MARGKLQGWCEDGNQIVSTSGLSSLTRVQRSFVLNNVAATVTIYLHGTVTIATLYSDMAGTSKANPFVAASSGQWFAYLDQGSYDVVFSGAGIASPFTLSDLRISPIVSVEDFGPIGTANDSATIQSATNSLGSTGGTVLFPFGTYSIATTIVKPRNVIWQGVGVFTGTKLLWTPSTGTAIVEADGNNIVNPSGQIAQMPGGFRDMMIVGPGYTTSAVGILEGGDPANVIVPSTHRGERTHWENIIVQGFADGVRYGNNTYGVEYTSVRITDNNNGINVPSNITTDGFNGGPIPAVFYGGLFNNNHNSSILLDVGFGVWRFFGTGFEYTGPIRNSKNNTLEFHGCLLEKNDLVDVGIAGPFITTQGVGTESTSVLFNGGNLVYSATTGTDAYMFLLGGFATLFVMKGTHINSSHAVTNMLSVSVTSPTTSVIDIDALGNEDGNIASLSTTPYVSAGVVIPYFAKLNGATYTLSGIYVDAGGANGWAASPTVARMRSQTLEYLETATFYNGAREGSGWRMSNTTPYAIQIDVLGRVAIGYNAGSGVPRSALQVANISVFANNAAAIAAGLVAGCVYRNGADPDVLCIVH